MKKNNKIIIELPDLATFELLEEALMDARQYCRTNNAVKKAVDYINLASEVKRGRKK